MVRLTFRMYARAERLHVKLSIEVSTDRCDKAPGLGDERRDLFARQLHILPVIAALSQLERLVQRPSERFGKQTAFDEGLIEVGENAGVL